MHISQKTDTKNMRYGLWKFKKNSAKLKISMPVHIRNWMTERKRYTDAKD